MKLLSTFATVWIAIAILGFVIPMEVVSENNGAQMTDVTIATKYWYQIENNFIDDGGRSIRSPSYHDTLVTSSKNEVTFNNYAQLHDERNQDTDYRVEWYILVYEMIEGEKEFVKSEKTGDTMYNPPDQLFNFQSITINVDFNGEGVHTYSIGSRFVIYEVQEGKEDKKIGCPTFYEEALVFETKDFAVSNDLGTGIL
jgi:hypothetical protein